ncbi:hypothetical protein NUU61_010087 [Penicillium alfredii]|uniref:Uncharacterized protein n=1 Tax=Penicillium alfredii TaxID=1506179 RepID=A0A9W9JU66_9EURO|nr:uncharacterized protein NUU61_010087 [Penicillium alfredii]KAJ5081823.1 hypothetical protein NUU61_010087 [Penicillium alfredii]
MPASTRTTTASDCCVCLTLAPGSTSEVLAVAWALCGDGGTRVVLRLVQCTSWRPLLLQLFIVCYLNWTTSAHYYPHSLGPRAESCLRETHSSVHCFGLVSLLAPAAPELGLNRPHNGVTGAWLTIDIECVRRAYRPTPSR